MTPTAELIHRPSEPPLEHGAFYRFVPIADPQATAYSLRLLAGSLLGSIVVAPEGVKRGRRRHARGARFLRVGVGR